MMTLPPRLRACAALVTPGGAVLDVGTDHARLPVFLLSQGICLHAMASDIGAGPLDAARQTISRAGLLDQINLILTDGLQGIPMESLTDIVIAGMGGETIAAILGAVRWEPASPQLILQPMTRVSLLRDWLAANGFHVTQEAAVAEDERIYIVMAVRYTGEQNRLSPLAAQVGLLSRDASTARQYIAKQAKRIRKKAAGLRAAGQDAHASLALADALEDWCREEQL